MFCALTGTCTLRPTDQNTIECTFAYRAIINYRHRWTTLIDSGRMSGCTGLGVVHARGHLVQPVLNDCWWQCMLVQTVPFQIALAHCLSHYSTRPSLIFQNQSNNKNSFLAVAAAVGGGGGCTAAAAWLKWEIFVVSYDSFHLAAALVSE